MLGEEAAMPDDRADGFVDCENFPSIAQTVISVYTATCKLVELIDESELRQLNYSKRQMVSYILASAIVLDGAHFMKLNRELQIHLGITVKEKLREAQREIEDILRGTNN